LHADRLARVRAALAAPRLAALVITHPPNIRYLTGLSLSAGALIVGQERAALIVDGRYATAAGAAIDAETDLFIAAGGPGSIDEAIAAALRPVGSAAVGIEADVLSVSRFARLAALGGTAQGAWSLVHTTGIVEALRMVKDPDELATLREAGRRLATVARRARDVVREGRTELEVAADIDHAVRLAGFERSAFETIVASGPNGALPHARPTSRRLAAGDGVVLDFGGVYDGYCVDLTRTLAIGPIPADFRRLFDAVRDAQAAAIAAVRPGVPSSDIDAAARRLLEARGLGEAFSHGTGHGLGLEVHEGPRLSASAASTPLAAGMVFTIEPGAYVPGVGGVRIEDDVVVVTGGCELLTDVPIEL
jgi:Xaa-Pro aminopeptidase